ncbi:MAG: DUF3368 domain-containing protein [Caldilineae bacterium]|nr:MAG: DUF3368 domain-containing protein [Caldilineae bacterium]
MARADWQVVLDDAAARRCAHVFDIPCIGTLGIILLAKSRGLIPSASAVLHQLKGVGFRIDEQMLGRLLPDLVNEDWKKDV